MQEEYGKAYYDNYDIGYKTVSYLESPELRRFFALVAREVTERFHPQTVLDAGCAMGALVSEFIKLGVEAYGLDYSEYAVTNADPLAVKSCFHGSLAEPFPEGLPKKFDLVTCMEVLEHMPAEDGRRAIANLCKVTDTIIFCSTPDDFEDKTHINVQQREYWASLFAENGFFDDLSCRPLFVTNYAVCYRRKSDWQSQIRDYERFIQEAEQVGREKDERYRDLEKKCAEAVEECAKADAALKEKNAALKRVSEEYTRLNRENARLSEAKANTEESYNELIDKYNTKRARLKNQKKQLIALRAQLNGKSKSLDKLKQEKEELSCRLDAAMSECEEAKRQAASQREQYAALDSAYQSTMRTYQDTCNLLAGVTERADLLENSRSYRCMAPLRAIKRTIKRVIGKTAKGLYHVVKCIRNLSHRNARKNQALPEECWPPRVEAVAEENACTVQLQCRRIGIYTFYDKDGIVDDYVLYYLKALSPWVEKLFVVCNGRLIPESKAALEALGCKVLVRENRGFDAWGVKTAIEKIGFKKLSGYDEVVISNNTFFGPVYGFDKIFSTMAGRKVDFWGISEPPKYSCRNPYIENLIGNSRKDLPEHIQTYFYCVRKRMLAGEAFRKFWMGLPELPDLETAAELYEATMTHYFSEAGYRYGCLMSREAYSKLTDNPLITMPVESIRDWGCPFFKRRAFSQDYLALTVETGQQSASALLHYIKEETDYPMELVWKNLLRTCHMCDLTQNLHLSRVFDKRDCYISEDASMPKAALFMHIYDHTMAPELAGYAANLPPEVDIYISTVSEEKKDAILWAFRELPNSLEIRVLPNRGRDVSALLTSFRDVVMNYEVACVTHDKKTEYLKPKTMGEGFAYMGYENILGGRGLIRWILHEFLRDPFLGLLCTPDPSYGWFATHVGLEWCGNYQNAKKLAGRLGLHVPMDEDHPPVAPYGSSFWFRTAAMVPLFKIEWTYDDFPAEPVEAYDGTIMHAIERIYPFVVQHSGYYSARVMTTDYAALEIGNLAYYTSEYTHAVYDAGLAPYFFNFASVKSDYKARLGQKELLTEVVPVEKKRGIVQKVREKLKIWAEL